MRLLIAAARRIDSARGGLRCTGCGCTDNVACVGGCSWVSLTPPVCSVCASVDDGVLL